ncbi:HAMP domain-containing protein [Paenibacillus sp. CGMCC 1.16610]|uniref:histidine kinase n=1 Tax=Paenibacillus anseongense TaxID=2682845 RepID=A0ABW9U2N5_9BACL|nr:MULTISPECIES: ATP-binding protein [Paenibacillus]MBA2941745.1 HAMP domain-containing protein [Paenibacillus sp. CGMCC 1.16610]MVQ34263.1 HAMP domain-containing protein [Paenibacillus anseongense]
MLNSFYRKLLFIYMSITVVSILAISGTIGYSMKQKTYDRSEKLLLEKVEQVDELAKELFDGATLQKDFRKQISAIEKSSNVSVALIKHPKVNADKLQSIGESPARKEWLDKVLAGNQVTVRSNFTQNSTVKMLIVGRPVVQDSRVVGAIFLYTPIENIQGTINDINRAIYISAVSVALLAMAVLYFVSRHFVKPIQLMSKTAEALALGDFSGRVPVRGKDEIASLSGSLNRMAGKLQKVEEGRKRFLSEISHELRTPLTTIRASLQGITDGVVEPEDAKEFIQVSLQETLRLSSLVDDLMELSSFEEKQVKLSFQPMDVSDVITHVVTQLKMKAKSKGIGLSSEAETSYRVQGDADRLRQVFINLLDNAINHIPEGSEAGIRVKTVRNERWIEVWDNGQGIAEEKLPHLFDRFYKADESRNRSGAGLGLTICKHIIEAHGGSIRVESKIGAGTVFKIFLPAA